METQTKSQIDLDELTKNIVENIENVLNFLGIEEYNIYPNRVAFPCPIHGGDNPEGCCIFTEGHKTLGNWACWTRNCQHTRYEIDGGMEEVGTNIFGFIRIMLSEDGIPVSYSKAISWAIKALNCDVSERTNNGNNDFIKVNRMLNKKEVKVEGTVGRDKIRNFLQIPCSYYLEKEKPFSKEILDKYDVGLCNVKHSKMYLRAVSPVYDNNFKFLGACGRNTQPQCEKCGLYHFPNRPCPTNKIEEKWAKKWINTEGQFAGHTFYNSWYAIPHIYKTGTAILVEGSGDTWRLEEAGIHISLGLFKNVTTEPQENILKSMPISNLIVATDNDDAGLSGRETISERLGRYFNIHNVLPDTDWGEANSEEIWEKFSPVFRKIGIYEEASSINLR